MKEFLNKVFNTYWFIGVSIILLFPPVFNTAHFSFNNGRWTDKIDFLSKKVDFVFILDLQSVSLQYTTISFYVLFIEIFIFTILLFLFSRIKIKTIFNKINKFILWVAKPLFFTTIVGIIFILMFAGYKYYKNQQQQKEYNNLPELNFDDKNNNQKPIDLLANNKSRKSNSTQIISDSNTLTKVEINNSNWRKLLSKQYKDVADIEIANMFFDLIKKDMEKVNKKPYLREGFDKIWYSKDEFFLVYLGNNLLKQ